MLTTYRPPIRWGLRHDYYRRAAGSDFRVLLDDKGREHTRAMPICDLGDVRLHYRARGEGPPVVGVMGFALDQRFWAAQLAVLTQHNRFVSFDNRGVGRSSGPIATTIDDLADDLLRLLDALELDRVTVLGASMGGAVAQRLALEHPERVSALVLAVTWARPIEYMRRITSVARELIEAGGTEALIEAAIIWMFTPAFFEVGQDAVNRMVGAFLADTGPDMPGPEILLGQLDAIGKHDALSELSQIDCPTLVAGGKLDVMAPYFASEEIAAAIPGARLATFRTGHGLMIEEMDPFNAVLSEFLAELRT